MDEESEEAIESREEVVMNLIEEAKDTIARRYGSAEADGEEPRAFHNLQHTQDVLDAAKLMGDIAADRGHITREEAEVLDLAAAYHDVEYSMGPDANEDHSADALAAAMTDATVFTAEEIELGKKAILSTKVEFVNGMIDQQEGVSYVERLMADADLSHFGQPTEIHRERSLRFLVEISGGVQPDGAKWRAFAADQAAVLSKHRFHTPEAEELFPHLQENIAYWQSEAAADESYPHAQSAA